MEERVGVSGGEGGRGGGGPPSLREIAPALVCGELVPLSPRSAGGEREKPPVAVSRCAPPRITCSIWLAGRLLKDKDFGSCELFARPFCFWRPLSHLGCWRNNRLAPRTLPRQKPARPEPLRRSIFGQP